MVYAVAIFAAAFLSAVAGTAAAVRIAPRIGLLDRPDGFRKTHSAPTPLVGGPVIALSCFGTLGCFLIYHQLASVPLSLFRRDLVALSLAGFLITGLGLFDDLRGVTPRRKLLIQILAAIILVAFGFRLDVLPNPFGQPIQLGLLTVPVTVLWLLACTNALNLVDGLDGLASGIALIAIGAILALAALSGNIYMVLICAAITGATAGFLLFNLPPAKAFLGDSGSTFLGFAYGAVAFRGLSAIDPGFSVLVPTIIFGVPIVDMCLAIARRWLKRKPIFSADRDHIHHRLLAAGLSRRQTLRVLLAVCVTSAALGVAIALVEPPVAALLFTAVVLLGALGLRVLWGIEFANLFCGVTVSRVFWRLRESLGTREQVIDCWACLHQAQSKVAQAKNPESIWAASKPVFKSLQLSGASLKLLLPGSERLRGNAPEFHWHNGDHSSDSTWQEDYRLHIPIRSNGYHFGNLALYLGPHTPRIPGWFQILEQLGSTAGRRLEQLSTEKRREGA